MKGSFYLNFLGIGEEYSNYENSKIVILPVPYEGTVSYKSGAKDGPKAIIESSHYVELYDIELKKELYKEVGIFTAAPLTVNTHSVKAMKDDIKNEYKKYLYDDKFIVMLGGEHSITLGAVEALEEEGYEFSVLSLDAHADLREEYEGSPYNHACVMRRVHELVPIVEVGVRSMSKEEDDYILEKEISVFSPDNIRETQDWITEVLNELTDKVYISLDVDVFDPSFLPATGTPEPDGLSYHQILLLLQSVFREKEVVGVDVVELSPKEGLHHCEFSMAKLIYKILNYKYSL